MAIPDRDLCDGTARRGAWRPRLGVCLIALLWSCAALAAASLADWRRQADEARVLAENDAPAAYAQAKRMQAEFPVQATDADRVRVLNLLARTEVYLALTDEAVDHAQRAIELARRAGDAVGEAEAELNVALYSVNQGRIDALIESATRSVSLLDGAHRPDLLGEALLRTAMMYRRVGQFDESVTMAMQAMDMARRSKDPLALACAHQGLAISYEQSDRSEEARSHYEQMRAHAVAARSKPLEAYALAGLGAVASKRKDYAAAGPSFEHAVAIFRAAGTPFGEAFALFGLANSLRNEGLNAQALALLDAVLAIYEKHPNRIGRWYTLNARSTTLEALGRATEARADAEQAYALATEVGFPLYLSESARRMAAISAAAGDHRRAYQLSTEAAAMTAKAAQERTSQRMI